MPIGMTEEEKRAKNPYYRHDIKDRPEGCGAEQWASAFQGECFVCVCGADSLKECKVANKKGDANATC